MHSFFRYCINPDSFLHVRTLKDFIAVLKKQSNDDNALIPYRESVRLSDYNEDDEFIGVLKAPRYFGAGVEALSEIYFDVFGSEYNLANYKSLDDTDSDVEDTGYDAIANTMKKKVYKGKISKISLPGNNVYIQVKGSLNPVKLFMTNDGSRVMNFYGNAQGHARMLGQGNRARFLLFTTAKDLHYKLKKNTYEEIDVIGYDKIKKKIDNNPFVWNAFFKKLGLPEIEITGPRDPEFDSISAELSLTNDI